MLALIAVTVAPIPVPTRAVFTQHTCLTDQVLALACAYCVSASTTVALELLLHLALGAIAATYFHSVHHLELLVCWAQAPSRHPYTTESLMGICLLWGSAPECSATVHSHRKPATPASTALWISSCVPPRVVISCSWPSLVSLLTRVP